MIKPLDYGSDLYNVLRSLGGLETEDHLIQSLRTMMITGNTVVPSYSDVLGVGYLYPHIKIPISEYQYSEIWDDASYINYNTIEWVTDPKYAYGILPREPVGNIHYSYNPYILHRYTTTGSSGTYTYRINITDAKYESLINPLHCAYYITSNTLKIPTARWITSDTIEFTAEFTNDIDFAIASNMVNITEVSANVGTLIDNPHSEYTYPYILVDGSLSYPIDTRFYPQVLVDKDCTVRVYNTAGRYLSNPANNRLILYPEYLTIADMYNSDNEYLNTLLPVDDVVDAGDSTAEILDKFSRISAYMYRIGDTYTNDATSVSDFIVIDNNGVDKPFKIVEIYGLTEIYSAGILTTPYDINRDLLFYHGYLYTGYTVKNLRWTSAGICTENPAGLQYYVFPADIILDDITLIKFNTDRDSTIINAASYIDQDNILQLHYKLNRFYRNMMVVKQSLLTESGNPEYVRVSTEVPSSTDDHLWFELLLNADPERFTTRPIETIDLYGLDPNNIPDDIVEGAYRLDLDPELGESSYTELLITYNTLSDKYKEQLVLENMGDVDYSRSDSIIIGDSESIASPTNNQLLIEDENIDSVETTYQSGTESAPDGSASPGDLYVQLVDTPSTIDDVISDIMGITKSGLIDIINHSHNDDSDLIPIINDMSEPEVGQLAFTLMNSDILPVNVTNNLSYIIGLGEPDSAVVGDLWLNIPATDIASIIRDMISKPLMEGGREDIVPEYIDNDPIESTMAFEFMPKFDRSIANLLDIFKERPDESLHKVHLYNKPDTIDAYDVWYELLDRVSAQVVYASTNTIVFAITNKLYRVEFTSDNIEVFTFDDILLNFNGTQRVKYISILADLINANVLKQTDINVFYTRLITAGDNLNPMLHRLYTGYSNVISELDADTSSLSVLYSTNIKRVTMDYSDNRTTRYEREAAYRFGLDYRDRDFAYIPNKTLMFVNGKYMPSHKLYEGPGHLLYFGDFDEIVATIDVMYSMRDYAFMMIKKVAITNRLYEDPTGYISQPSKLHHMEYININDRTYRGYYHTLLSEYIFSGKLLSMCNYILENPDEAEEYIKDFKSKFSMISDRLLFGDSLDGDNRLVIPTLGDSELELIIKEME